MKRNNIFLIIATSCLLLTSCCKDVICPSISKEEMKWIPYRLGDTLIFKDYDNDSTIRLYVRSYEEDRMYTREHMTTCYKSCVAQVKTSLIPINGDRIPNIPLYIEKMDNNLNVISDVAGTYNVLGEEHLNSKGALFDLRRAEYIDSLTIGNQIVLDVYKYKTSDFVNDIEALYVKKDVGIIKISFRNGFNFQLKTFNQ
jgi:hypothetical protein